MTARRPVTEKQKSPRRRPPHCNTLDGRRWLQNSISVWSDVRKTTEEARLKHPALFPTMLAERLIETLLPPTGSVVLDPFAGSGSTLVAAGQLGKQGIGFELSGEYVSLARRRLNELYRPEDSSESFALIEKQTARDRVQCAIHHASAERLLEFVAPATVDLCISSPPYWNILNQRRTADYKATRHYGNLDGDLGAISDYEQFLDAVTGVFRNVLTVLRAGSYCCLIVMDLRKRDRFFPLHSDLAQRLSAAGYILDDLIIWNRQSEYNNLRPLGYPSVFRVNKVHEFIVLLKKPK